RRSSVCALELSAGTRSFRICSDTEVRLEEGWAGTHQGDGRRHSLAGLARMAAPALRLPGASAARVAAGRAGAHRQERAASHGLPDCFAGAELLSQTLPSLARARLAAATRSPGQG